jgi:hypothetical protein
MTIINRMYLEPSDILAVQLECKKCVTTVTTLLKDWKPEASRCPNCSVPLIEDAKDVFPLKKLAEALNHLLTYKDTLNYRLRLEFYQPD